jgi:hypothetical protein
MGAETERKVGCMTEMERAHIDKTGQKPTWLEREMVGHMNRRFSRCKKQALEERSLFNIQTVKYELG